MKKQQFITFLVILSLFTSVFTAKADEGMWLAALINQNHPEMEKLGLELSAEQLYSINNSSLKDAVVRLGPGFCTGEMISKEGLMLTNHHCGFDAIQKLSTTTSNYLKDGFWAMTRDKEKPAGFSVSFLLRMEEVTGKVLDDVTDDMTYEERMTIINENTKVIEKEVANKKDKITGDVKSMFKGNRFFLMVYQTYPDVRLVGAPPSSVGKYGGDTDNWMWPRHTGDFSMFRIYAGKDNKPAEYSKDNKPYQPKHHLPVSLGGVEKGDYAMIFGYPGSTDRYLTSYGVKHAVETEQPARVKVRREKLDIYEEYQAMDDATRLKYASKHARVSNYWKYFIGQTRGLKRLNVYDQKKTQEDAFMSWVNKNNDRKKQYGDVMKLYEEAYAIRNEVVMAQTYLSEAVFGTEILSFAWQFHRLESVLADKETDEATIHDMTEAMESVSKDHFKNYDARVDEDVMAAMMKFYNEDIPKSQQPEYFQKWFGDETYEKCAAKLFKKSMFDNEEKVMDFLKSPKAKKIQKDPAYKLILSFIELYRSDIGAMLAEANKKMAKAQRLYVKGLQAQYPDKLWAPDANSTMRITYGQVLDYFPADAVYYRHYTTIDGIIEKYVPGDLEFDLPGKLLTLYESRDFGQYADDEGNLRVCFLSNNDITGGNSGSPVINAKGHLIGTAFDGNWEAMSGDIVFEEDLQRTISVDIRYTLWIIDKFAGAGHLVDEMTIVK